MHFATRQHLYGAKRNYYNIDHVREVIPTTSLENSVLSLFGPAKKEEAFNIKAFTHI